MPEAITGPLRILHLEDDPVDADLARATLTTDGILADIVRVETEEAFTRALAERPYDVILADYNLPAFDGLLAQDIARQRRPDTPFIFLSGTLGEEIAIERLKCGATDYVLKQRMARLPAAVRRALDEAAVRAERRRAQEEIQRLNAELDQRVIARTAELAAAEQRLQDILDHSPALIYVKDLEGRFLVVNARLQKMFTADGRTLIGRTDYDIFPHGLAELYRENDRKALDSMRSIEVEERVLHGDNVRVYTSSKFPLVSENGAAYAVCAICTDVTERKKADEMIQTARREAERANRAKSDFLSRMSHDLRTPLNAILGFAQLLAVETLTVEQLECVQQIQTGGRHLLDLINEVLDIARIEAGHLSLSPEPVNVGDIASHAAVLVAPLGRERGIGIIIEQSALFELSVRADRQRLNQVLLNLLSNAVKYNRDGGTVTISIVRSGSRLRLQVSDTGAGIPAAKQQLLFTPFERLGAESTSVEGTGLGLTLARGLAEAMGGTVGFTSEVDHGSTFWVELQIAEAIAGAPAGATPDLAPLRIDAARAGTILYIEDNVSNVRLMQRVFGRRPAWTLVHAANGREGLSAARQQAFDAILLDLHLPDAGGEEVLRMLWNDPALRRIPVIVVSADATPAHMRRLLASGASAYLTKPLELACVLDTLDRVLATSRPASSAAE